jgi:predicted dehydrogenase
MIKLGIVGTGGMANAHAMAFKNINDVEIVAVCDVIEDRVRNFAKEYNINQTFTSFDEMLENSELDAISNVTPDSNTKLPKLYLDMHIHIPKLYPAYT